MLLLLVETQPACPAQDPLSTKTKMQVARVSPIYIVQTDTLISLNTLALLDILHNQSTSLLCFLGRKSESDSARFSANIHVTFSRCATASVITARSRLPSDIDIINLGKIDIINTVFVTAW
jgi:hypothetical protein